MVDGRIGRLAGRLVALVSRTDTLQCSQKAGRIVFFYFLTQLIQIQVHSKNAL